MAKTTKTTKGSKTTKGAKKQQKRTRQATRLAPTKLVEVTEGNDIVVKEVPVDAAPATPKIKRNAKRVLGVKVPRTSPEPKARDPRIPAAGTTISRTYTPRGGSPKTVEVLVRETDFLCDGIAYSSLSAIATKLADGTPKNGLLWFGLTKRETKKDAPATAAAE